MAFSFVPTETVAGDLCMVGVFGASPPSGNIAPTQGTNNHARSALGGCSVHGLDANDPEQVSAPARIQGARTQGADSVLFISVLPVQARELMRAHQSDFDLRR